MLPDEDSHRCETSRTWWSGRPAERLAVHVAQGFDQTLPAGLHGSHNPFPGGSHIPNVVLHLGPPADHECSGLDHFLGAWWRR